MKAILWLTTGLAIGWISAGFYSPKLKSFTIEPKAQIEKKYEPSKGYRP